MSSEQSEFRIEHDTMGEVRVPTDALWRAQTQRAVENFPVSGSGLERAQIRALGLLKSACATVNGNLGLLDRDKSGAIVAAAGRIADGEVDAHFPVDVFQTGSGTSSNMNTNEVIASLCAAEGVTVHPNDDVNMSQSSNDTFPTATHVAATEVVIADLVPALKTLATSLESRAAAWRDLVKPGRTHLMDAVPVTLGQEFGGYARQLRAGIDRVCNTLPRVGELPIGGTAAGTGLNAPDGFGSAVVDELRSLTGLEELRLAEDPFEAQAARDGLVELSGAMRTVAVSLTKIANDIRWMGSGPMTGLSEIHLPDLQPGSSIMPGKVNPVIPESVSQVAYSVAGADATVSMAVEAGQLQLNAFEPIIAHSLFQSVTWLERACQTFRINCVNGITANERQLDDIVDRSVTVITALAPVVGYAPAARLAKEALARNESIADLVVEHGLVEREQLGEILKPERLTGMPADDSVTTDPDSAESVPRDEMTGELPVVADPEE